MKKGGADYIVNYLKSLGFVCYSIEHPLEKAGKTVSTNFDGVSQEHNINGIGIIRWLQEIFINYKLLRKYRMSLIIAVDPLNFFSANMLKIQTGAKVLYHSIDYSEKRFENIFLNNTYHFLYKFAVSNADIVTFVSCKMEEKIRKLREKKAAITAIYLPNSPEYEKIPKYEPSKKNKYNIVYSKSLIMDSEIVLLKLLVKNLSEIGITPTLNIIGGMSDQAKSDLAKFEHADRIVIHGLKKYQDSVEIMAKSYISFAWYEGIRSFEHYADSLKIREYAAAGLPCVCNKVVATSLEMEKQKAGILCDTAVEAANAIGLLINDEHVYLAMRKNALTWAEKMDKKAMLDNLMSVLQL